MEKEKIPLTPEEKPPLPTIEYDGLSASHSPLDEKCEKLLPDNYDSMVCGDDDYTYGSSSVGGCCGGGRSSGSSGRRGSGDGRGGVIYDKGGGGMRLVDKGGLIEGGGSSSGGGVSGGGCGVGGSNNNNCERKKPGKKGGKNCKVNIVQPADTKEPGVAKKVRKNSREPEIRDTNLVLALFVLFCFNLPFGLLATMFSLMAGSAFRDGKKKRAKCHSRTSMVISLLGIATTAALVMCVIFFLAIKEQSQGY
ncbi:unnamed protein product [Acanthosepion pharaonis]|uniref:Uncharacterized protein n=1 Tax=Acanthosepion pharaonis TaxID=158019 RepID=A0A812BS77_ACAPH|nr:unnamed protein product [Sepia pharaonis]